METTANALRRILIVEDNEDNRDILVLRLKSFGGFDILEASNGKEALEIVEKSRPDLIVMDLNMPVLNGWEATRVLRSKNWGRHIPIIALTAYAMDGDQERALSCGCDDYIAKPITDHSIILRKIHKLLQLPRPFPS